MRIALVTTGRFTLVDLARELDALGHEVRVYSLVPPWHTARFGLPARCNRWLMPYAVGNYAIQQAVSKLRFGGLSAFADRLLLDWVDRVAALRVEPCEVMVVMSGLGLRSIQAVQRRYGAKVFLERSSRHILSQREILTAMNPGTDPVPDWIVARELAGYAMADLISVPADHVAESFLERGFLKEKLFQNPFGTALDQFQPTPPPIHGDGHKTVLMTGAWSRRKGCDVLVEAWRKLPRGTKLLHVGAVLDAALPKDPGFEHVDAVPQRELLRYYERADVFALASREEGLAVVQIQALACGLRLVCTSRTGGADLAAWTTEPGAVRVVPPDDADALANALRDALQDQPPQGQPRDLLGPHRADVSWRGYAQRYAARMAAATQRVTSK